MTKKRNQPITLIATPTKDLNGLHGVSSSAVFGPHFGAKVLDFSSDIADLNTIKVALDGNSPIA